MPTWLHPLPLTSLTLALPILIATSHAANNANDIGSCAGETSARLMTLGLAIGNIILFPFGTALGGYALWTLLKDEGRRLFEPA